MKRFCCLLLTVVLTISLFSCNKSIEKTIEIPSKARYVVKQADTEIEFTAVIDGDCHEFTFLSPTAIAGLKAKSSDGVNYSIEYSGITLLSGSKAVAVATDFCTALELLKTNPTVKNGCVNANIDCAEAKGLVEANRITKLEFTNNNNTRIYKIITEATE